MVVRRTVVLSLFLGALVVLACRGTLWPGKSSAPSSSGGAPVWGWREISERTSDYARPPDPVSLEPFPFRILIRWDRLQKAQPVVWTFEVTNVDGASHTLEAVVVQGYAAAFQYRPVDPPARVHRDAQQSLVLLEYGMTLAPGETRSVQVEVTAYMPDLSRGVLAFCVDGISLTQCFPLPIAP